MRDCSLRCFHRPRATNHALVSASPSGGGGRRPEGVVGKGVGCRKWVSALKTCETTYYGASTGHAPRATCRFKNPHPGLPPGGGRSASQQATSHELSSYQRHYIPRTTHHVPTGGHMGPPLRRDNAHHESRATTTSHKLQATCRLSRFPGRGQTRQLRSWAHAGREAGVLLSLTRKCWNAGESLEPFLYRLRA